MTHGNTGRRNAAKDEKAESYLHIRVKTSDKARWVKQAQAEGVKLAEWVRQKLDAIEG